MELALQAGLSPAFCALGLQPSRQLRARLLSHRSSFYGYDAESGWAEIKC